jgi:hypothetical protein
MGFMHQRPAERERSDTWAKSTQRCRACARCGTAVLHKSVNLPKSLKLCGIRVLAKALKIVDFMGFMHQRRADPMLMKDGGECPVNRPSRCGHGEAAGYLFLLGRLFHRGCSCLFSSLRKHRRHRTIMAHGWHLSRGRCSHLVLRPRSSTCPHEPIVGTAARLMLTGRGCRSGPRTTRNTSGRRPVSARWGLTCNEPDHLL